MKEHKNKLSLNSMTKPYLFYMKEFTLNSNLNKSTTDSVLQTKISNKHSRKMAMFSPIEFVIGICKILI